MEWNLYRECCFRSFGWHVEKTVKVIDIFLRLKDPYFHEVNDLVDSLMLKLVAAHSADIKYQVLFVCLYFGNFCSPATTVPENILKIVQRRLKNRIYQVSQEEALLVLSYFISRNIKFQNDGLWKKCVALLKKPLDTQVLPYLTKSMSQ